MAELSKIRKNGVDYDIKDSIAREAIEELKQNGTGGGTGSGTTTETVTKTGIMVNIEADKGTRIAVEADTTEEVALVHSGKNLMPTYKESKTLGGIAVTVQEDGTLRLFGTATGTVYINLIEPSEPMYLPKGDYTMSITGSADETNNRFIIEQSTGGTIGGVGKDSRTNAFSLSEGTLIKAYITVRKDTVIDTVVSVQLEPGTKASGYEKCLRTESAVTLPHTVSAFDGMNIFYTTGGNTLTVSTVVETTGTGVSVFDATKYSLPILYLTGDTSAMDKDNAVDLSYIYGERSGTASVKWQGSSSLKYPKKNYTVKFDNPFEAVEGWGEQKKYCMKANYIDFSHARNLCCAKLWGEIVASRNPANEALAACPNYGAVDGFPICIVINGEYQGVYTFNIPKDGWMLNMGSGTHEAILCADLNSPANNFKAEAVVGGDKTDFELEYTTDEDNTDWVQTSLNNLIRACINSDGSDLDTTIAAMLDLDSAIDYYIFSALIDHRDGIGKNYLLHTYDGTKWVFDAYDMDSVFGLHWDGEYFMTANAGMSFAYLKNAHRLAELIITYKKDKLKSRYSALRDGSLSEDNVQMVLRNFAGSIPHQMLEEDNRKWTTIPNTNANTVQQIIDWYRLRVTKIDKEVEAM